MQYDVTNWYWTVGADHSRVFSSRERAFVPATDPAYASWLAEMGAADDHFTKYMLAAGRIPTPMKTGGDLLRILRRILPDVADEAEDMLIDVF